MYSCAHSFYIVWYYFTWFCINIEGTFMSVWVRVNKGRAQIKRSGGIFHHYSLTSQMNQFFKLFFFFVQNCEFRICDWKLFLHIPYHDVDVLVCIFLITLSNQIRRARDRYHSKDLLLPRSEKCRREDINYICECFYIKIVFFCYVLFLLLPFIVMHDTSECHLPLFLSLPLSWQCISVFSRNSTLDCQ